MVFIQFLYNYNFKTLGNKWGKVSIFYQECLYSKVFLFGEPPKAGMMGRIFEKKQLVTFS